MLQDKPRLGTLMEDELHVEGEAFEPLKDKSKEVECVEVELVKDKFVEGGNVKVELVDIEGEVSEAIEV
ncbi:15122_t:CDS:2 [Dentiscutata heterogama]|uniref:15122_t:CDS:1 n=1 Tax=Dentiscutata heterogama TaxID=1316150 RepID=A0ACA9K6A3_9GLOM|nr:15122_t:CDS:2 [Dentiscutata heterogama]